MAETERFIIERPSFDPVSGTVRFRYRLNDLSFVETVAFPDGGRPGVAEGASFLKLLDLTAIVLGVSYFKLRAPTEIAAPQIPLTAGERTFALDVYENGLGEFYARNDLRRFGRIRIEAPDDPGPAPAAPDLADRILLPIGGGKDSLVSAQLLEAAGLGFTPFAVNPKGPILGSVERLERPPVFVTRTLDPEMIRLGRDPAYYNGHVPSTAINSMVAALAALLFSYDRIVLSNERSASEGNQSFDGREANHQHSKSMDFEQLIASILHGATAGALGYFSLLRPYSEAKIARLFARQTRFDHVFSSCNENFKLAGGSMRLSGIDRHPESAAGAVDARQLARHDGPLWCGRCPKCHFVFLIMAPVMTRERLVGIFGQDLLAQPAHERSFRELTGLAGQKPWECVGEIEEAAACLFSLTAKPEWRDEPIVRTLGPDLLAQYGRERLEAALAGLMADAAEHLVPEDIARRVAPHAL
jgi:hypothetical protein